MSRSAPGLSSRFPRCIPLLAGLAMLVAASLLRPCFVVPVRDPGHVLESAAPGDVAAVSAARLLGGFRPLAVDLLWLRADSMFRQGRIWELASLFRGIVALDPENDAVREYAAWHLAYNVSLAEPDPDRRFEWFTQGMELLGAGPGDPAPRGRALWPAARMVVERFESMSIRDFSVKVERLYGSEPLALAAGWLEDAVKVPGAPSAAHAVLIYCADALEAEAKESGDPSRSRAWRERKAMAIKRAAESHPEEDWTTWQ